MPTITPPLLSPGHWTSLCRPLCDPPSVPRSTIDPSRHKAACRMPPGRPEYPATQPRSLMPPPWLAPPNPGSVATVYRAFAVSRASGLTDIGVRDSVPQPHNAAISSTYARDRMGSSLSTSLAQVLQEVTIMRGAAAARAPDPDIKSRGVIRGPNPACQRKRSCSRLSVPMLAPDICQRAMRARDPRFDGVFFVGITTTGVYCRPVCPSRVARPSHRRFFESAALAERAGFRPCLRCRPELAPGRSQMDAVPRLARAAAQRIAAGALNGHALSQLARELGVSERHLRRAMEREIGVSPLALAQTHRLLLAKRLLADTALPVTRIAFASGFRSLRRFNSVFRERYGLSPSALRPRGVGRREYETVRLTLAYRPPFAWDVLIALLAREALPGVEVVRDGRYARTGASRVRSTDSKPPCARCCMAVERALAGWSTPWGSRTTRGPRDSPDCRPVRSAWPRREPSGSQLWACHGAVRQGWWPWRAPSPRGACGSSREATWRPHAEPCARCRASTIASKRRSSRARSIGRTPSPRPIAPCSTPPEPRGRRTWSHAPNSGARGGRTPPCICGCTIRRKERTGGRLTGSEPCDRLRARPRTRRGTSG